MKLHELSPAPGSTKKAFRVGRGAGSGNGKQQAKDTRARKPVPAAAYGQVLKAARCHCRDVFLREASTTSLQNSSLS